MRRYRVTDVRRDSIRDETLAGLMQTVELDDDEVDEVADLEVGNCLHVDGGHLKIQRLE